MRFHLLACDYDGTLASRGKVDENTLAGLERLRRSGRKLVLVTGRELLDLLAIFPHLELFDRVVAENGALLYRPATGEEVVLAEPPPEKFVAYLRNRGVTPLSVGRVIVATWEPQEAVALEAIRQLGLELQIVFNKGAVMVLPSGVNKSTGLAAALAELELSPHNAVAIGDAENDHAMLALCGFSVAVANALPVVKERADFVTAAGHGAGVVELIGRIVESDLQDFEISSRHEIPVGTAKSGHPVAFRPYGQIVLIAGASGAGKSTFATGVLERLQQRGHQFCIIDPEGDYSEFEGAVVFGDSKQPPAADDVMALLQNPAHNAVVNMIGIGLDDRPGFFQALLPRIEELRGRTGRPHWLLIDETHHLLPSSWDDVSVILPKDYGLMMVTVHPDSVSPAVLSYVDTVVAIGDAPEKTIRALGDALGGTAPRIPPVKLEPGEGLLWLTTSGAEPEVFRSIPPASERRRHQRKYAEGDLGDAGSFYFQGPDGKLNLQAQNLAMFVRIAKGVDDETWAYHLGCGDYSRWFRRAIKDEELAEEAEAVERQPDMPPEESRRLIRAAIEKRYTAPAASASAASA